MEVMACTLYSMAGAAQHCLDSYIMITEKKCGRDMTSFKNNLNSSCIRCLCDNFLNNRTWWWYWKNQTSKKTNDAEKNQTSQTPKHKQLIPTKPNYTWLSRHMVSIQWNVTKKIHNSHSQAPFSALTLLVWQQEEHPACKNWVVR